MTTYPQYTELLSKIINRTATDADKKKVAEYEQAQPKQCPKCQAALWSTFNPPRIVHDIAACQTPPKL
jgi:hypothetical protein